MARLARYDAEIKALGSTSGQSSNHRSDHYVAICGGRGGINDRMAYMNGQATPNSETHLADVQTVYIAEAWTMTFSRIDEGMRRHFEENTGF